ncbi:MAG: translation initiation factor IF-3 [Patescibacteria group bacterium]
MNKKQYPKPTPINNRIKAEKVRLIDEEGNQLGIVILKEALKMAYDKQLDLVQVTEKVDPPICKITEYGKYLYSQEKKKKKQKAQKTSELKGIRLSFNISPHDMEIRAKQAEKFLTRGDKIKIEIILRGRQRALTQIANEKIKQFIILLNEKIPVKTEKDIVMRGKNLLMIISKQ